MIGLRAATSMPLNRFVEFMLGMLDAPLTSLHTFGMHPRHRREQQTGRQQAKGHQPLSCTAEMTRLRAIHATSTRPLDFLHFHAAASRVAAGTESTECGHAVRCVHLVYRIA